MFFVSHVGSHLADTFLGPRPQKKESLPMRRFNISTNLDNCFHLQLKCKMQIQIRAILTDADANGARLAVKIFCAQN